MKRFSMLAAIAVVFTLMFSAFSFAQQCTTPGSLGNTSQIRATPAPTQQISLPAARPAAPQRDADVITKEEADFLANGPRLYSMEKALELSKATGKPVVCWMGKHLFANESARKLSQELAETTIQAAMDKDNTPYDKIGFRVKYSSNNYADNQQVYFTPLAKFDDPGRAEKILALARGGKAK